MSGCLTLRKSNCQKCYKCIRRCPVKAIRFSGNQASIIDEECVLCGQCIAACPKNVGVLADSTGQTEELLRGSLPVYVSLDPSYAAYFDGAELAAVRDALMKLGFAGVYECAAGAEAVKNEYERILREERPDVLISSACRSVNLLVQKYFPDALPCLADVLSPMEASCAYIKNAHPHSKCVYIGPCAAGKDDAESARLTSPDAAPDSALTFGELSEWLKRRRISLKRTDGAPAAGETSKRFLTRLFGVSGGIINSMERETDYTYLAVSGTERCMAALRDVLSGRLHRCFIEMSSCEGGCIGAPAMNTSSYAAALSAVLNFAGKDSFGLVQPQPSQLRKRFEPLKLTSDTSREPSADEVTEVLRDSGKLKPHRTLNCGSCGYDTCWDFAVAVCRGKAELSMCLPHTRDKAESFSDTIVKNTPNAVVVLNEALEIQEINDSALKIMRIGSASDVLGEGIGRIMNPAIFTDVLKTGSIYHQRDFMSRYKLFVERTVVHDRESHLLICIMRDVTDEENERRKKESISRETAEVADRVVAKQMRIVQEIASLLGETAAETKVALLKLKEFIADE